MRMWWSIRSSDLYMTSQETLNAGVDVLIAMLEMCPASATHGFKVRVLSESILLASTPPQHAALLAAEAIVRLAELERERSFAA